MIPTFLRKNFYSAEANWLTVHVSDDAITDWGGEKKTSQAWGTWIGML